MPGLVRTEFLECCAWISGHHPCVFLSLCCRPGWL